MLFAYSDGMATQSRFKGVSPLCKRVEMPGHLLRGTCYGICNCEVHTIRALRETKCQLRGVPFEPSSKTEKRILFDGSKSEPVLNRD